MKLWIVCVAPVVSLWVGCTAQDPSAASRPSSRPASPAANQETDQETGPAAGPTAGAQDPEPAAAADLHDAFDAILRATVRDERVDYLILRRDHWPALLAYLARLERTDPAKLSRDARLAFYLNLYNATMIRAVVERLTADYSPADAEYGVFKERLAKVGERTLSLDQIENQIVRPEFNEPRIHVALVCGAVSCPPLLPRAYRAVDLDRVLEANMRRFVNGGSRNRIDHRARKLELSSIFKWYAPDFGGENGLAAFVDRHTEDDVSDYEVSFLDYSWQLNLAPPADGRWVTVNAEGATANLRAGGIYEVVEANDGQLRVAVPFGDETVGIAAAKTAAFPR